MARKAKKGESGHATSYIARNQAIKRLQLTLKDFRRLCIIKGVYPHEPRNKKSVPGSQNSKTFYYLKDIQFLSHEPIIDKFRDFRVFLRKLKTAIGKQDPETADRLRKNQPVYKLDHIVKERYPTFIDSLRDIDDALSMCCLFATLPKMRLVNSELIQLCRRLTVEFVHYVIESKSLRKVFISVKGYYYQAEIQGQLITWVVPHQFAFQRQAEVDFKIMVTFTEFYSTMLGFVNYKLYNSLNLHYPPVLTVGSSSQDDDSSENDNEEGLPETVVALNQRLKAIITDTTDEDAVPDEFPATDDVDALEEMRVEREKLNKLLCLFKGLKFFLSREVPRESATFVIRSFGGEVSWDKTLFAGATYGETDETITHQIVDRPSVGKQYLSRYYVQPQWIYDSVNARMLLPVKDYFIGTTLPPHLSPFVEEKDGDYVPPEKEKLLARQRGEDIDVESDEEEADDEEFKQDVVSGKLKEKQNADDANEMSVAAGKSEIEDAEKMKRSTAAEEKRLAVMMIPKKKKRLYDKIMFGKKRKTREAEKLRSKREEFDKTQKRKKID